MGDISTPDSVSSGAGFSVFITIFVILAAAAVIGAVYRSTKVGRAGHNPLTLQTDLAVRALDSEALAPAKTVEQRLAEIDSLHARGVISEAEWTAARAAILAG